MAQTPTLCRRACGPQTCYGMNVSSVTGYQSLDFPLSSDLMACGEVLLFWSLVLSRGVSNVSDMGLLGSVFLGVCLF